MIHVIMGLKGYYILRKNAKKHSPSPLQTQVMHKIDSIQTVIMSTSTITVVAVHFRFSFSFGS